MNRDIIYRDFESEIFTLPLHDESIPPEHYNKTSASESLIEVLSEELRRRSSTQGREIKILPPKQMLQIFLILLAHVKAGNTSEILLNKIWQTIVIVLGKTNIKKVCYDLAQSA